MAIHTNDFRGNAQENVTFTREESSNEALYEKIKMIVKEELTARNIPHYIREDVVKSGGLFGTKLPIMIISHPDSTCKYFSIGIFVNNKTVCFPLLGESAENTKYNKKQFYQNNNNFILAAATKYDEFKLQQEHAWQYDVLECFNSCID